MMKQILLIILCLVFGLSDYAQAQRKRPMNGMGKEKIEEAKKEFLAERLLMTPEQEKDFWPLYEAFEKEMDENRRKMRALKRGFAVKSDKELEKDLESFFILKENETTIEKKYFNKFKSILSIRQVAVFYQSEQQFKRWLFEKLKNHIDGPPPMRDDE